VILFDPPTAQLAIKRLLNMVHGIEILPLCGALCHLLSINILDVRLNPPDVGSTQNQGRKAAHQQQ
jgi:hypothetical protein